MKWNSQQVSERKCRSEREKRGRCARPAPGERISRLWSLSVPLHRPVTPLKSSYTTVPPPTPQFLFFRFIWRGVAQVPFSVSAFAIRYTSPFRHGLAASFFSVFLYVVGTRRFLDLLCVKQSLCIYIQGKENLFIKSTLYYRQFLHVSVFFVPFLSPFKCYLKYNKKKEDRVYDHYQP